jgi:hypothetical protein
MIHVIDYRDHFFKYPYHHLIFTRETWQRFLDPGDLPRHRPADHVLAFQAAGMDVRVLRRTEIPAAFGRIEARIAPEFHRYSRDDLAAATAVLVVSKPG